MTDARFHWCRWLFLPLILPIGLLVLLPLSLLALASVPYFRIFPDRHAHVHDFDGTPHQRARLAEWRRRYSRLTLVQRTRRAFTTRQRRCKLA
jgi:hypothetical protein